MAAIGGLLVALAGFAADRMDSQNSDRAARVLSETLIETKNAEIELHRLKACDQKWDHAKTLEPSIARQELVLIPSQEFDDLGRAYIGFLELCPDDERASAIRLKMLEFEKGMFFASELKYDPAVVANDKACAKVVSRSEAEWAAFSAEREDAGDYTETIRSFEARSVGNSLCVDRLGRRVLHDENGAVIRDGQSSMLKDSMSRGR